MGSARPRVRWWLVGGVAGPFAALAAAAVSIAACTQIDDFDKFRLAPPSEPGAGEACKDQCSDGLVCLKDPAFPKGVCAKQVSPWRPNSAWPCDDDRAPVPTTDATVAFCIERCDVPGADGAAPQHPCSRQTDGYVCCAAAEAMVRAAPSFEGVNKNGYCLPAALCPSPARPTEVAEACTVAPVAGASMIDSCGHNRGLGWKCLTGTITAADGMSVNIPKGYCTYSGCKVAEQPLCDSLVQKSAICVVQDSNQTYCAQTCSKTTPADCPSGTCCDVSGSPIGRGLCAPMGTACSR